MDNPHRRRTPWRSHGGHAGCLAAPVVILLVIGLLYFAGRALVPNSPGGSHATRPVSPTASPAVSDTCSPKPCLSRAGLTLLVSDVRRDPSGPLFPLLPAGEHWLTLSATFLDTKQEHDVTDPQFVSDFVSDETGPDQEGYSAPGGFVERRLPIAADCGHSSSIASPGGSDGGAAEPPHVHLRPGDRYGPIQLCYIMAGPPNQRVVIHWGAWQPVTAGMSPPATASTVLDLPLP